MLTRHPFAVANLLVYFLLYKIASVVLRGCAVIGNYLELLIH